MNFLNFLTSKTNCTFSFIPSIQFWTPTSHAQFPEPKHHFGAAREPEVKQLSFTPEQGIISF